MSNNNLRNELLEMIIQTSRLKNDENRIIASIQKRYLFIKWGEKRRSHSEYEHEGCLYKVKGKTHFIISIMMFMSEKCLQFMRHNSVASTQIRNNLKKSKPQKICY